MLSDQPRNISGSAPWGLIPLSLSYLSTSAFSYFTILILYRLFVLHFLPLFFFFCVCSGGFHSCTEEDRRTAWELVGGGEEKGVCDGEENRERERLYAATLPSLFSPFSFHPPFLPPSERLDFSFWLLSSLSLSLILCTIMFLCMCLSLTLSLSVWLSISLALYLSGSLTGDLCVFDFSLKISVLHTFRLMYQAQKM